MTRAAPVIGDCLPFHAQCGEERGDLGRGRLAGHDLVHDADHLRFVQVFLFHHLGNGLFDHDTSFYLSDT